jgi:FkbM family methyltransferase
MQLKLVSHHVGGRAGSIGLPISPSFERDFVNVLYDADADSIEQIRRHWAHRACDTRVYPYCLAKSSGAAILNINFDAYTSSLLGANQSVAHYYMHHAPDGVDYVLGDACRPMERRQVFTVALDELMRRPEFADAPPDFLSLDTQGTEHEILEGAHVTLRRHVLAVYCEAEIVPVYQGQKLLCDLVCLMRDAGFHLAQCKLHEGFAPLRAPIGARAKGQPFGSDLLFLREIDNVQREIFDPLERHLALQKLALISVLFQLLEHGLHVLDSAGRIDIPADMQREFGRLSYYRFLERLREIVAAMPQRRPPTYGETKCFEEMQARFRE